MDVLYYSNYCKHSQKLVQTLAKANMADKISFVNIDKRKKDPKTNQTFILLENGNTLILPPNINSVPSLLLMKQQYKVISGGDDILKHYHPQLKSQSEKAVRQNGEPSGYSLTGAPTNIMSEKYTMYNMTPEELSAKGRGGSRPLYNYTAATEEIQFINTPPETYKPDKISTSVTIDALQQQRMDEISSI
jgi:hypothetical protein